MKKMSSSQDKIITKKLHHEGVVKKRSNHVLYEIVDETQKMRLKVEKKEKPKEKEILDNYRYLETKQIKRNDERRRSIVRHQRLSSPVGKETPFMRNSFKEYKTKTTLVQKRPKISNYEERKTYNPKKIGKRSSTTSQNHYYKKRGNTPDNYNNKLFNSKSSRNKNYKERNLIRGNSNPHIRKNQITERGPHLSQNKRFQNEYNLAQNQNIEGNYNLNQNENFQAGFNLWKNQNNEGSPNLYQIGNFQTGYNLGQNQNIGTSNQNKNNISGDFNYGQNQVNSNLYQNQNYPTGYNFGQNQEIEGASILYQNNKLSEGNQEIEGASVQYKNNDLQAGYNLNLNQLQGPNYEQSFLPKRDVYLGVNALEEENDILRNQTEERDFNRGNNNVPGDNYFGLNSINVQGFNNVDQSQYYDTYPKENFNLEQNIYNKGNINQKKILPFYPINVNSYDSQTERLIYCECCGKLKRPKEYQRRSSIQKVRQSISKEIIAEESSKGDYVIKYNDKVNQPITYILEGQIQGNDNLYGLDENYASSRSYYCPKHGYI